MQKKTAVFILTHFFNTHIRQMYQRLAAEMPPEYDLFLYVNCADRETAIPAGAEDMADRIVLGNQADMLALPYPARCQPQGWSGTGWTLPGHEDLNVMLFYRQKSGYDYYWGIEYDVDYVGNWSFLFRRFEQSAADLIGTTMYHAAETPHKSFPLPFVKPDGSTVPLEEAVRGLYPIFRLSGRLLQKIDEEYTAGWGGHYELLWGAIAKRHGMEIEDFGGRGAFTKPHNRNVFYFNMYGTYTLSPGTFVFRPAFKEPPFRHEHTLWHPVKPDGIHNWHPLRMDRGMVKNILERLKPVLWKTVIWLWFAFVRRKP